MAVKCFICKKCFGKSEITFHSFPKNIELREKWIQICGVDDIKIKPSHKICSRHFTDDSYLPMFPKSKGLKQNAVPSLLLNPSNMANKQSLINVFEFSESGIASSSLSSTNEYEVYEILCPLRDTVENLICEPPTPTFSNISCSTSMAINPSVNVKHNQIKKTTPRKKFNFYPRYVGDCTEEHFATPQRRKQNLHFIKTKYYYQTKQIKSLKQKNRNLKKKILSLQSMLKIFQQKKV